MAFGLFNKKQPSKPEKTPVKAKAPAKKAEAPKPAAPQPVVEEEGFSLDFTNYASPEEVAEVMSPMGTTPLTTETKSVLNPAGLDFGALVGEPAAAPEPASEPAPPAAKAPTPAPTPKPAAPAPAAKAPASPPATEKPASLADSMGMDFTSFVQKAEAMVEGPAAPAAKAPAPAAKAPAPAAPAAKPAAPVAKAPPPPAAKVPVPPPAPSDPDTDDTVDFAPPMTLDFMPTPAVPPKAPAAPAPSDPETDDTVDFAPPLNFEVEPKLAPRPVMAPSAPQAPAPAPVAKAPPPPAPKPAAPVAKAPAPATPPAPKPAAPVPAAKPAAAPVAKAPAPKAAPAPAPKSVAKPAKGPKSKASIAPLEFDAGGSAPNSVLISEVESGKSDVPAMIEEVAMLFANDQAAEALQKLDKAIDGGKLKSWSLGAWLMRFDAYQQLGRKSEFEEKALDFVVKFERSPPAWTDAPADSGASRPGSSANINLSGSLSAASAGAFMQLRKAAEKQPKLRIDFAKLEGIDKEGAKLLLSTLKSLRGAKKEVYISGESQILNLLRNKAVTGDASADQNFWLLLLDLYQSLGMLPEFEEAAVDYAVTYEVSPPSWEARPKVQPPVMPRPEASGVRVSSDDSFRLQGEIAGQQDQLFKMLVDYSVKASPVVIDFAHVHRIDFVNAGRLAGVLEKAGQSGKAVVLRGAGEMTIALFAVVGLHRYARIIPRK